MSRPGRELQHKGDNSERIPANAEWPPKNPPVSCSPGWNPPPEKLTPGVDLYPTFGHTPGHVPVLLYSLSQSTIIAGDAVLAREHFDRGDLGDKPLNLAKAKTSLPNVIETADIIVPGHDNVFVCRGGGGRLWEVNRRAPA
jgi:glyoxylase-like metal-dependent hydrolase (beta-lactamase superfamily II)